MRILVRMPNWLGDAVMATPALHNLLGHFPEAQFVLVGSPPVAELFAPDPRFLAVIADRSRAHRWRWAGMWQLARRLRREHGPFAAAWTFQNSASSRLMLYALRAPQRIARKYGAADLLLTHPVPCDPHLHHAQIYNTVVNGYLGTDYPAGPTSLRGLPPHVYPTATAGIHPGAAYGGAKRWEPHKFAETAIALAGRYHLVLLAGPQETGLTDEIEARLRAAGVQGFTNLAGRTTISELVSRIAGLDMFVCNDSGPMHIAGAYGVPTVAVFGSTDPRLTCPWRHDGFRCIRRELPCSPCQERVCPLEHHACMREIESREVVAAAWSLAGTRCPARTG
jgi:heptosyltransferase II